MKKYKFITIRQRTKCDGIQREHPHSGETFEGKPVYGIFNNRTHGQLGILSWYKPWKQYVFSGQPECVFNLSCLEDVIDFIKNEIPKEKK